MKFSTLPTIVTFVFGTVFGALAIKFEQEPRVEEYGISPVIEVITPSESANIQSNCHELHICHITTTGSTVQKRVLFEPPDGSPKWMIVVGSDERRTVYTAIEK